MKARTLVFLLTATLLAFNYEARAGIVKEETLACRIFEQAKQVVENYVIKKYDSVNCAGEWKKIDAGIRKKCSRIDASGYIREFYVEIFCDGEYRICTEIFLIMDKGNWHKLILRQP